jgi:hypothetical protein
MNKMYYAVQKIELDTCFVADDSFEDITELAEECIAAEFEMNRGCNKNLPSILEVKSIKDLPESWKKARYWGTNPDKQYTIDFLKNRDNEEYELFLKLKQKYEP